MHVKELGRCLRQGLIFNFNIFYMFFCCCMCIYLFRSYFFYCLKNSVVI